MKSELQQVAHFLLGGPVPAPGIISRYRLGAYAYWQLAPSAEREALREDFLRAHGYQLFLKAKLLPLVRAWREAGIDVLVFKGFYLSEFVYEDAASRAYHDIDLVVRPEQSLQARQLAKAQGWTEVWTRGLSLYRYNHEEARLDLPGRAYIEMHRYVLDANSPFDALQKRFTHAVWENSQTVAWEGTEFLVPSPTDSLLIGLVLARSWSAGDNWHLKPHDFLDFKFIVDKYGISKAELESRANQLNCARTLTLFLRRCNPWKDKLELRTPTFLQRQLWGIQVMGERGSLSLERLLVRCFRFPGTVIDTVRFVPSIWSLAAQLRTKHTPERILEALPSGQAVGEGSLKEAECIARGVKWAAQLLHFGSDPCLLRSLGLYAAYRKRGYPAVFIGSANEDGGQRHAYVELPGRRLDDMLNLENCDVGEDRYHYP